MTLIPSDPRLAHAAAVLIRDHMSVRAGESVLITADNHSDLHAADALHSAAALAGANPMLALIPRLPFQGKLADPYLAEPLRQAMCAADVWIDLTHPYIAGSDAHGAAEKAGRCRCLVAGGMDADALVRLYGLIPLDALYEVQSALDDLIAASTGKTCRLTDDAGTDVTFVLAKATGKKPRHAEKPGASYTVPGSVVMYPDLESVRGSITIVAAMHQFYGALRRPLTLEVDGRIRRIVEPGPDARLLDRALRLAGGGEYGHVIHFSYGLHPMARFRGDCFIEDIRTPGANAIGFGRPWWEKGGGENHPDGLVLRQTLAIDGVTIIEHGLVVAPPEIAARAAALAPDFKLI